MRAWRLACCGGGERGAEAKPGESVRLCCVEDSGGAMDRWRVGPLPPGAALMRDLWPRYMTRKSARGQKTCRARASQSRSRAQGTQHTHQWLPQQTPRSWQTRLLSSSRFTSRRRRLARRRRTSTRCTTTSVRCSSASGRFTTRCASSAGARLLFLRSSPQDERDCGACSTVPHLAAPLLRRRIGEEYLDKHPMVMPVRALDERCSGRGRRESDAQSSGENLHLPRANPARTHTRRHCGISGRALARCQSW